MARKTLTPDMIVRIEKSGNRYKAWDTDGNKRTSEITTTTRKKAHDGNYLLGRFTGRTGKTFWRKVDNVDVTPTTAPDNSVSSVEVPSDHEEVLNFIHSS